MIKRISIYTGVLAFGILVVVGFVNHLNWFTILIRGIIGFFVFYFAATVLGIIGAQSILHQELLKSRRIKEQDEQNKQPKT